MISFDFLHAAQPPLIRKISQVRVPRALYAPLAACCAIIVAACGACAIEEARLHAARAMESAYRLHYEQSRAQVREAGVELRRMRETIELAAAVRAMAQSGYRNAERLAFIANALPSRAWLTSIAYDGDDVVLEGRASNLPSVSAVLRGMARVRGLGEPVLGAVTLDDRATGADGMLYTVRLRAAKP